MTRLGCMRCDYCAGDRDDLAEHAADVGHPLCGCCGRSLRVDEPRTCVHCVGRVRRDLATVVDLYALLPEETTERGGTTFGPVPTGAHEHTVPGGDALALLAAANLHSPIEGRQDGAWSTPADPLPPLALLASWADDWLRVLGKPATADTSMSAVAGFLGRGIAWASQHYDPFPDFAAELAACRAALERVVQAGEQPLRAAAPCFECGGDLVRPYRDPKPCPHHHSHNGRVLTPLWSLPEQEQERWKRWAADWIAGWRRYGVAPVPTQPSCGCDQGGLPDPDDDPHAPDWACRRCGREYTREAYNLALRAALENGRVEAS